MNKQEIQNKIDNLQKQIDELKETLNKTDNIRWRAERNKSYYTVAYNGAITSRIDDRCRPADDYNYSIGNYFETEKEAHDYKENLITNQSSKI